MHQTKSTFCQVSLLQTTFCILIELNNGIISQLSTQQKMFKNIETRLYAQHTLLVDSPIKWPYLIKEGLPNGHSLTLCLTSAHLDGKKLSCKNVTEENCV